MMVDHSLPTSRQSYNRLYWGQNNRSCRGPAPEPPRGWKFRNNCSKCLWAFWFMAGAEVPGVGQDSPNVLVDFGWPPDIVVKCHMFCTWEDSLVKGKLLISSTAALVHKQIRQNSEGRHFCKEYGFCVIFMTLSCTFGIVQMGLNSCAVQEGGTGGHPTWASPEKHFKKALSLLLSVIFHSYRFNMNVNW